MDDENLRLLTIPDVADRLGCSEANVYGLINAGELAFVPIGKRKGYRVAAADLAAFVERRKVVHIKPPPVVMRGPKPRLKHIKLP